MWHPLTLYVTWGLLLTNLCVWNTEYIKSTCRAACHALWKISKIRKYMDMNCTKQLVHGLLISKLDYANAILYAAAKVILKETTLASCTISDKFQNSDICIPFCKWKCP